MFMPFREAVFFRCIFIVFLGGGEGGGSARVKMTRICYSGREELCMACSTYLGERPATGFLSAALSRDVFTVVDLCRDIFVLILADQGMFLRHREYFGPVRFY